MKSITASDLQKFREDYQQSRNKQIERQVTRYGIERFTLSKRIFRENPMKFNLELPSYHLYDQHDSGRCWCFSSLNLIEGNIAQNLNIVPRELSLSANYLTFYDKLEKTNYLYDYVIENDVSLKKLRETVFGPQDPIGEGGHFMNFINLVGKYGLAPSSAMPENKNTNNSRNCFIYLWREKARTDALELFRLKSEISESKLCQLKTQKLGEMYAFLSKISGEPPQTFGFRYTDRSGYKKVLRSYTPVQFRDEFLTLNLRKFQLVRCDPLHKFYTYQTVEKSFSGNPFGPEIEYVNLPKSEIKRLAIIQLKAGLPVRIGTRTNLFKDKKEWVLDTRLHDYTKLGVKLTDYTTGFTTKLTTPQHAMEIVGAQIESGQVVRWKVENTHTPNRFYAMNDNFFDDCVIGASIYLDFFDFDLKKLR